VIFSPLLVCLPKELDFSGEELSICLLVFKVKLAVTGQSPSSDLQGTAWDKSARGHHRPGISWHFKHL